MTAILALWVERIEIGEARVNAKIKNLTRSDLDYRVRRLSGSGESFPRKTCTEQPDVYSTLLDSR